MFRFNSGVPSVVRKCRCRDDGRMMAASAMRAFKLLVLHKAASADCCSCSEGSGILEALTDHQSAGEMAWCYTWYKV